MFCIDYYPYQSYIKDADEIKVKYNPNVFVLKDFLELYKTKSIVLDVTENFDEIDAKMMKELLQTYNNFKIMLKYQNNKHLALVQKYNLPFFFFNFVTTIDQVYGFIEYHPTDMYICEQLGFSIDKISKILHNNNIKVRVFPNICQSSFSETNSLLTFFIRPDDIAFYKNFVDVFEIFSDRKSQGVIFKIYKEQKWFGDIHEIIPTFKGELDGRYLLNDFGIFRSKCGKRCLYKPGSCDICLRLLDLSKTFKENQIVAIPSS